MEIRIVLWRDGAAQVVEIDAAVLAHGQIGDFVAVLFEALAGVEHGLVLGHLRDDVIAFFAVHLRGALDEPGCSTRWRRW